MNNEKILLLQNTPLGKVLNSQEIELAAQHIALKHYMQGEPIITQGKKSNGMFIICQGSALETTKILGAGSTNLDTLTIGNFIGEITIIDRHPYTTSVVAAEKTLCIHLPNSYFDMLAFTFPEASHRVINMIMTNICNRLKFQNGNILNIMQKINITPQTMLGQFIKTFNKPKNIAFSDTGFTLNDLMKMDFFSIFSDVEFNLLFEKAEIIYAPNQCTFITEGDKESGCYIILRGAVQTSIVEDNKFAKLCVLGPMSLFCSITYLLPDTPATFNYASCEHAILLKFTYETMQEIRKEYPELWYKLFSYIAQTFVIFFKSAQRLEIRLNSEIYNG